MKNLYKNAIYFIIVLFVFIAFAEYRISNNTKTHIDLKYDEVYNHNAEAEIVILGNSHAAFGINPEYLEYDNTTCYNFAMGGCTPQYCRIWYEYVFRKNYPKPKYMIFSVDWAMFDTLSACRPIDTDIRHIDIPAKIKIFLNEKGASQKNLVFNNSVLYKKPQSLQYIFFKKYNRDLDNYYNGYVKREGLGVDQSFSPSSTVVNSKMVREFDRFVQSVINDSIPLILISTPEHTPSWPDSSFSSYTNKVYKIAHKYSIPYYNFNNEYSSHINTDSTFYMDWVHLNSKGADEFSKLLFEVLTNNNIVTVK